MYKYGTLKLDKVISRKEREIGRIMEGMNQTRLHCRYIWTCHKETACITATY
jgi:hypothetical protein